MTGPLFRNEVIEARRESWLGPISIAQPLPLWVISLLAVAIATAIVVLLAFGEYSRRSRVTGQLVPSLGLATVVSPADGVVVQRFTDEGADVAAGAPLMRVQVPRAMAGGRDVWMAVREQLSAQEASLQRLDVSQGGQVTVQMRGLQAQLASAQNELNQVEQAVSTKRQLVKLSESSMARFQVLSERQYVSRIELDQHLQATLALRGEQQDLERLATGLRRAIAQIEAQIHELPVQRASQRASIARERALLGQERVQYDASGELVVNAPIAGMVTSRLVEPGQAVRVGQPLMSLLPAGSELEALLMVPSRAVGFIQPGDHVQLRYQAFPYQKFGHYEGRVVRVSRSAINPGESVALSGGGQATEPYYRVLVALDRQAIRAYGKLEALRPGMLLEADIMGERRRLVEWLLEPLYALRGTVT